MRRTILLLAAVLGGCGDADEHDHPAARTGRQLYELHCAPCHQVNGAGAFLRGVPPVSGSTMNYRRMVEHIQGTMRADDTRMPTFSEMSQHEAELIAVYIRRQFPTP